MGKRSDFDREARDFYATPLKAILPLIPHIPQGATFCEPCAGGSKLIEHLESNGLKCVSAYDILPLEGDDRVTQKNARYLDIKDLNGADYIITNPPWKRALLHPMIDRFRRLSPTWLLFDSDWKYTLQSSNLMQYCRKVVPIGRVQWFEGTGQTGKDNCALYLFVNTKVKTEFVPRCRN